MFRTVPSFLTSWGTLVILRSSMSSCHRLESWPSSVGSSRIPALLLEEQEGQHDWTSCFKMWEALHQDKTTRLTFNILQEKITGSEILLAADGCCPSFFPNNSITLAGELNSCKQLEDCELIPSTSSHGLEWHERPSHKDFPSLQA